jgi:uncharacterized membrane protein
MPEAISVYVPQVVSGEESARRGRAAWAAWALILAGAAGLVASIVLAPVLRARGATLASHMIYQFFQVACHQIPDRSFHVEGHAFAVCARCFGLYAGALAGVAVYPLARPLTRAWAPARGWLLLAAAPTAVDFALGFTGLWDNTHWSRFSTGTLLGAVAAFYVVPGLVDLFRRGGARPPGRGRAERLKEVDPDFRASCG